MPIFACLLCFALRFRDDNDDDTQVMQPFQRIGSSLPGLNRKTKRTNIATRCLSVCLSYDAKRLGMGIIHAFVVGGEVTKAEKAGRKDHIGKDHITQQRGDPSFLLSRIRWRLRGWSALSLASSAASAAARASWCR